MRVEFKKRFGPWAVVTGATSGIGDGFARLLAERGLNLVLVARREARLKHLSDELRTDHGVETRVLRVDLAVAGATAEIADATAGLDVGLLVSSAGAAAMGAFVRVPVDTLGSMLQLNVNTQMSLAHHFASRLLARDGGGGILLVSSMAGLQGTPYSGNYAGAKAYVLNLGEAMNYELRGSGVNVTVLVPGPTSTPSFHERTDIDLNKMPMPPMRVAPVVAGGLRALERNKAYHIPGLMNRVMAGAVGRRLLSRRGNVAMWGKLLSRAAPEHLRI